MEGDILVKNKPKHHRKKCDVCGLKFIPRLLTPQGIKHNEILFRLHVEIHEQKDRWS